MVSPANTSPVLQSVSGMVEEEEVKVEKTVVVSLDPGDDEDDYDKLHPGLPLLDKMTLGSIWIISFIYSLLTDHILSKKVDLPCSINHEILDTFGILSVLIAIVVPAVVGPITVIILQIIISVANIFLPSSAAPEETRKQEQNNFVCVLSLSLVFLVTYITSMIISETMVETDNVFHFVLVKYIAGE